MYILWCILIGYGIGCLSPSYVVSKIKKIDVRKKGSGNLGATNVGLVIGKRWGVAVMIFDILKAYIAVKLGQHLFSGKILAGVLAGSAAMLGHNHPFYLKFRGGKGLATFGGLVLALNPIHFLILLTLGIVASILFHYGVMLPLTAAFIFPFVTAWSHYRMAGNDWIYGLLAFAILIPPMLSVVLRHRSNFRRIREGTEIRFLDGFRGKRYEEE